MRHSTTQRSLLLAGGPVLGLLILGGCRSAQVETVEASYPPVESASFGTMRNVSVSDQIWFGGTPGEGDLELAQRRGIATVIDLSTAEEAGEIDTARACEELGIEYVRADAESFGGCGDALVDFVLGTLEREGEEQTLMYCGSGSRCAMLLAIFRATQVGVPLDQALVEARRAGMRPKDEEFVRLQVDRLSSPSGRMASPSPPNAPTGDAPTAVEAGANTGGRPAS